MFTTIQFQIDEIDRFQKLIQIERIGFCAKVPKLTDLQPQRFEILQNNGPLRFPSYGHSDAKSALMKPQAQAENIIPVD